MRGRTVRLVVGVLGTLWAVAAEWIALGNGGSPSAGLLQLAIGLTYLYGGLTIWAHAPANRTGAKMTAVGLTWFMQAVAGAPIPYVGEIGLALEDLSAVFLLTLVLSYPSGILGDAIDRIGIAIMLIGTTAINTANLFPTTPLLLNEGSNGLYAGLTLGIMASTLVIRRWIVAPPRTRRDLTPVLVAGGVFIVTVVINIVRRIAEVPDTTAELLIAIKDLAPAAIPVALLIGFYRQSEHRLQALVDAIPDPMLRFTRDGRRLDAGATASARGSRWAATAAVHDDVRSGLLQSATRHEALEAAARALDEGGSQTFDFSLDLPGGRRELEARLAPSGPDEVTAIIRDFTDQRAAEAEIRRSRARLVQATDAERRRLERDLHDGAQQHLVAVALALRLLRARLTSHGQPSPDVIAAADDAAAALKAAMTELRELALGIHPAILTEAGLGEAIGALAARSGVPVEVIARPDRRLPPAVEATAYFVVSEALANVAKYASASRAEVDARCVDATLRIRVTDDGVGGADPTRGSGIRGLEDRVAALGGRVSLSSLSGHGTVIAAEIPIA